MRGPTLRVERPLFLKLLCSTPRAAARLESTHRKLRSTLRTRNEKALAQLRGAGACLQRATQAVQGAMRTVDAALEDLATKLQVAGAPTPGSPVAQNP